MRLNDPYINYIIVSAYQSKEDDLKNRLEFSRLQDKLIYKDFTILEMGSNSQPSFLAYKDCDNNELRYDAIELMDNFKQEFVIVKYLNESDAKKILFNGTELLLGVVEYSGDSNHHNFYVEGQGFSFEPRKRYWTPKKVTDFKSGMIVEILNNDNQWIEKEVKDPEVEFERMYKVLSKYNKLRTESKDIY
tara:strand:+ start:1449 stop:2018 length:570 start_codon:yes stop_codon:yes gene_type:complete